MIMSRKTRFVAEDFQSDLEVPDGGEIAIISLRSFRNEDTEDVAEIVADRGEVNSMINALQSISGLLK